MAIFGIFKKLFGGSQQVPVQKKAPTVYDYSAAPVEDLDSFDGTAEKSSFLGHYCRKFKVGQ